jgi:hypothetical protein
MEAMVVMGVDMVVMGVDMEAMEVDMEAIKEVGDVKGVGVVKTFAIMDNKIGLKQQSQSKTILEY